MRKDDPSEKLSSTTVSAEILFPILRQNFLLSLPFFPSRLENRGKGKKKEEEGEERWSWKTCRSRRSEAVVFPRYSRASFTSKQRDQPSDSCIIGDPRTKCGSQRESSSFSLFFDYMKRMNSQCPIESSAEREDRREKIKVDSVPACSDPWPAE